MNFNEFRQKVQVAKGVTPFDGTLLAYDPGETTGWSFWSSTPTTVELIEFGQIPSWPIETGIRNIGDHLIRLRPNFLVIESYRIYRAKTESHAHSNVPTLQIIGIIQTLAVQRNIEWHFQSAQQAKAFVDDFKLRDWGFYQPGQKHARDSMRHGLYYLLFR